MFASENKKGPTRPYARYFAFLFYNCFVAFLNNVSVEILVARHNSINHDKVILIDFKRACMFRRQLHSTSDCRLLHVVSITLK